MTKKYDRLALVGIIRTAGTNCDAETVEAVRLAGGSPHPVHIRSLISDPAPLAEWDLVVFPGGFANGDDLGGGTILAAQVRHALREPIDRFLDRGGRIAGICNGFQVLVKAGLLPGWRRWGEPEVSLTANLHRCFEMRWVPLRGAAGSPWTAGLARCTFPVAHGEGRLVGASPDVLARIENDALVAFRYGAAADPGYPDNPNGSAGDISGLVDPSGQILGLMPHPERFLHAAQHPGHPRRPAGESIPDGLRFWLNALHAAAAG